MLRWAAATGCEAANSPGNGGWVLSGIMSGVRAIAVVIPCLDEAGAIGTAVASVRRDAAEVVVVDGGSKDSTVEEARASGARVLSSPRGRALQMDAGARQTCSDWLLFLHADTRLEAGWAEAVRRLPADVVGGAFRFRLDSPRPRYRLVEAGVRLRCALLRLPYGDQALFVRRDAYLAAGGFGCVPILEDVDLVRRLRKEGRLAFPSVTAVTSARRWEERGFLSTTARNLLVMLLDAMGVSRDRLARYYGVRG